MQLNRAQDEGFITEKSTVFTLAHQFISATQQVRVHNVELGDYGRLGFAAGRNRC